MSSVSSGLSVEVRRTIIDRSMVFCSWMTMSENCTQLQNYQRKMAQKMQREEDLRTGLRLYKSVKWFFLLAMILLQFKDPFDLWKLQGWEIWGGVGEVRVGIGIKTREQRGCHCQLQCCLLLFQTQPGRILLSSLISHYAVMSAVWYWILIWTFLRRYKQGFLRWKMPWNQAMKTLR